MDVKEYIRGYEVLKGETFQTLEEAMNLEMKWLQYHFRSKKVNRSIPQKRKKEFATFLKKSFENAKELGIFVYNALLPNAERSFKSLMADYKWEYEKRGVSHFLEKQLATQGNAKTIIELMEHYQKEQETKELTSERWLERVNHVVGKLNEIDNFKDALELEEEVLQLTNWTVSQTKEERAKLSESIGDIYHVLFRNADNMLKMLGYEEDIESLIRHKSHKNALKTKGFMALLHRVEENGLTKKMIRNLLSHISLEHPKEEFQQKEQRHFVIHAGPTNSGKTYHAIQALKKAQSGLYLAPIRLLAFEIYNKLNKQGIPCNLRTGEMELLKDGAKHQSLTVELTPFHQQVDVAVVDEMQWIEDEKRGYAWLKAIFGVQAKEIHLCMAPYALSFVIDLIQECGDTYEIHTYDRQTELHMEQEDFQFPHSVQKGDALIAFTKQKVLEIAEELRNNDYKVSVIYGKIPPESKQHQVELFTKGETDVLVATDAIGIGLNLPIRRVIFTEVEKFDGNEKRLLTTQEVKQIAGRAGRAGLYKTGYVNSFTKKEHIFECLEMKETPILKSVIAPTIEICDVPVGTLRQKLIAWKKAEMDVPYLAKADIQGHMKLLSFVQQWEHELGSKMLFKTLFVPFDSEIKELLFQWIEYVKELKNKKNALQKPTLKGKNLYDLEIYFQKLNLYYNFSRKFRLQMNLNWLHYEKRKTTDMINQSFRNKRIKYA